MGRRGRMEAGGFVEIGDGGNGGNVGDEMKLLRHDVVVGQGEGVDLACRMRDHPMCRCQLRYELLSPV